MVITPGVHPKKIRTVRSDPERIEESLTLSGPLSLILSFPGGAPLRVDPRLLSVIPIGIPGHLLPPANCQLPTVYCLLFTVYCLLSPDAGRGFRYTNC